MTIAAYDSDLTAANGGELTPAIVDTDFDESTDAAWDDAGAMVAETNFYINGTACISAQFTKTGVGTIIFIGTTFTVDTDGAITIWSFWASPTSLATYANGGVRTLVGNTLGDFYAYKASGSNFEPNPVGGWYNYAIDPASATIDTTVGSPSGTWTHVGMAINATAQARGNPHAVDAIRAGRCTMEVTLGDATAYGTFEGMANFDDSSGIRYALFQSVPGGYRWQGLMSLGVTATAVDFRSSNANIVIANTPQVSANFNKIEVHHASSNVEWNSITVNAYGVNDAIAVTTSAGSFEAVANATIALNTCIFIDMLTFIFQSNSTMTTTSFQRCGLITQGGATFTGCTVSGHAGTHAILATNPSAVGTTNFISGGTGHALRCDTIGTYTWSNTDTGYTGTRGSNLVSSTGSADAMFYNNSGGLITLNISGSGQQPTVRNGAGATTQVNADVNVTFSNMKDNTEVRIYKTSDDSVIDGIEDATAGTTDARTFTWTAGAGTDTYYILHNWDGALPYYQTIRVEGYLVPSADTTIVIAQQIDRNAV